MGRLSYMVVAEATISWEKRGDNSAPCISAGQSLDCLAASGRCRILAREDRSARSPVGLNPRSCLPRLLRTDAVEYLPSRPTAQNHGYRTVDPLKEEEGSEV
jgi:hypothetical protein